MAKKASGTRSSGSKTPGTGKPQVVDQGFGVKSKPTAVKGVGSSLLEDAGDGVLLSLVGAFKRIRLDQAARFTEESTPELRRRVKRLKQRGWLKYTTILAKDKEEGDLWTLWPTPEGLEVVGLKKSFGRGLPSLANLSHDFSLVEIGLNLIEADRDGEFYPERLVKGGFGFGQNYVEVETEDGESGMRRSHRPDGVYRCGDGTLVVVENESGVKDRKAREWMMFQNEGYALTADEELAPSCEEPSVVHYYGISEDVLSPIQGTQELNRLQRVRIEETPGLILWNTGSFLDE
jgi:hypothetical protein